MTGLGEMELSVGANISGLTKGLKDAEKQVSSFGGKVKAGSDKAAFALQNLGRVAQDAPFGFIGITNNINPLVESFQRLRAETGSVGGALKALVSGLGGVGGVGLAVSLITSGILVFGDKLKDLFSATETAVSGIKSLDGALANVVINFDAAKASSDRFNKSIDALRNLRDVNAKLNVKDPIERLTFQFNFNKAEEEAKLNELIKLESDAMAQISANNEIVFKKGSQELINLYTTENDILQIKKKSADFNEKDKKIVESISATSERLLNVQQSIADQRLKINQYNAQYKVDLDEINKKLEREKEKTETIADVIAKMRRGLGKISAEEDFFGINKSKDKISEIEGAINILVSKFKLNPKDTLIQGLFGEIKDLKDFRLPASFFKIDINALGEEEIKAFNEATKKLGTDPRVKPIKLPFRVTEDSFEPVRQRLLAFIADSTELLSTGIVEAFSTLGDSIGAALAHATDPVGSFFGGLATIMAKSLKELGKYVIQSSTLIATIKKALNAAFAGNPALGIIAGIGLIAIGSALEKSIPKFATGVNNFGGGTALVGERGPELVTLPKGSNVTPNDKLGGLGGGMSINVTGQFVQRGTDMIAVITKTEKLNNRIF